eukprot:2353074-Rhodomonas_salina.1
MLDIRDDDKKLGRRRRAGSRSSVGEDGGEKLEIIKAWILRGRSSVRWPRVDQVRRGLEKG